MNVKNNKRKRESIEKIEKVFIELLQTKELNEITVSDICKRADLNRSTFYANYADVYELADKIKERLEKDVEISLGQQSENDTGNGAVRFFRHVKENQLFYKTYFKLGYDNDIRIMFYDTEQAEKYFGNKHIDYHIEFFRNGFNAVIKKWLANGCIETPEEMAEVIISEYQGR